MSKRPAYQDWKKVKFRKQENKVRGEHDFSIRLEAARPATRRLGAPYLYLYFLCLLIRSLLRSRGPRAPRTVQQCRLYQNSLSLGPYSSGVSIDRQLPKR